MSSSRLIQFFLTESVPMGDEVVVIQDSFGLKNAPAEQALKNLVRNSVKIPHEIYGHPASLNSCRLMAEYLTSVGMKVK